MKKLLLILTASLILNNLTALPLASGTAGEMDDTNIPWAANPTSLPIMPGSTVLLI